MDCDLQSGRLKIKNVKLIEIVEILGLEFFCSKDFDNDAIANFVASTKNVYIYIYIYLCNINYIMY